MTVEQLMLDLAAEKANNQKAEVNISTKKKENFILYYIYFL